MDCHAAVPLPVSRKNSEYEAERRSSSRRPGSIATDRSAGKMEVARGAIVRKSLSGECMVGSDPRAVCTGRGCKWGRRAL